MRAGKIKVLAAGIFLSFLLTVTGAEAGRTGPRGHVTGGVLRPSADRFASTNNPGPGVGINDNIVQIMARARVSDASPPRDRRFISHRRRAAELGGEVEFPIFTEANTTGGSPVTSLRVAQPGPFGTNGTPLAFTGATLPETSSYPPDTMGAVGPAQFIVAVNGRIRTFNKNTGLADGVLNASMDTFFNSVMTPPANNNFTSDPRIRYDRLSGRWFVIIIDVPGKTGTSPNRVLIAVSDSSVITAGTVWSFYFFQHDLVSPTGDTGEFADYPTLGIDANALYIGVNIFNATTGSFDNTTAFVVQKSSLLTGGPIAVTAFRRLISGVTGPYTPQGVDNYDPNATEGYIIGVDFGSSTRLRLRRVSNPGSSTPTISGNVSITVSSFAAPIVVPSSGTSSNLDGLDERLLAAHYRNGSLWTSGNVGVNSSGGTSATTRNGVRWYKIGGIPTGQTPSVQQSGTIYDSSSTNIFYWMGTVMVSGQGHAVAGFSASSTSQFVGAAVAGRLTNAAAGTFGTPIIYSAGAAAYSPPYNRWGDYSYTSLDPNDDMTMWTIQENVNAANSYAVQIGKFSAPPPALPISCSPAVVTQGVAAINVTLLGSSSGGFGFYDPGAGFSNRLATVVNGGGITLNSVTYVNPTNLTLNLTIATNALDTARTISVINPDGQTNTSIAAILTVNTNGQPPIITIPPVAQAIQCGSNATFAVIATGTATLNFQWRLDNVPVSGATNATFTTTNVHLPSHTVAVVITNFFGSASNAVALTVIDTLAPVIALNGAALLSNELGLPFTDPGATANDLCVGVLSVTTNGVVNINLVGTNTLTYRATDGNGNTNTATRTVIVRDTTPPVIAWSFTNLVLTANASCSALMTNVTGTNFILATDLSGALTITQSPTNNAPLSLGTNLILITVADAATNKSVSTNRIIVRDQTPPVITLNGGALLTNEFGVAFIDPGVTASDACSGILSVVTNGVVNVNLASTNTLAYTATDSSGNTNAVTRIVIVRDTTPPAITWSFTNLFLSLDTNCSALMPDVTGTNFILAGDLSGAVVISQSPTNGFILPLGTNLVVFAVADDFGNTSFATNQIIVRDAAPPFILIQPQSQTNTPGNYASFSVTANACTAPSFQWFFSGAALANQTGNFLLLSNLNLATAGNYSVVVTSSGGSATSTVAVLTVNLFASSLTLGASANPDGFRDNVNFAAFVTPTNATGAIQFFTNGTPFDLQLLVNGAAASTNFSTLPRGTNLIVAIYSGDLNYLPATNALAQIVTNHPPEISPAFFTLIAGLNLNLPITSLATNWSDVDGDVLFISAIAASTNGVTVTNATPSLFYFNPNFVDDQFVCTVSDGFGGTNFQTVNITVVPQTNSTPNIISFVSQPASGVTLQLNGGYGSTYVLESVADLLSGNWQPLATNTLGITGVWQFTDFGVTNDPVRFYRLKLLP